MLGSKRSCSQIQSRNGSSFDPAGARAYRGGTSLATALATVSRARPVSLATSRCERPSTSTNRRTSAHCCTPTTRSSSRDHHDHARLNGQPDNARPPRPGLVFNRRDWTSIHSAPTPPAAAGPPLSGGYRGRGVPPELQAVVGGGDQAPFRAGSGSAAALEAVAAAVEPGVGEHRLDHALALGVEAAAAIGRQDATHERVEPAVPAGPGAFALAGVGRDQHLDPALDERVH